MVNQQRAGISREFRGAGEAGRMGTEGWSGRPARAGNERGDGMVGPWQIRRGQRWRARRMHAARSISSSGPSGVGTGLRWFRRLMSSPASRSVA